jgi:hypothetical protein
VSGVECGIFFLWWRRRRIDDRFFNFVRGDFPRKIVCLNGIEMRTDSGVAEENPNLVGDSSNNTLKTSGCDSELVEDCGQKWL